jgi:hypothetical protein
VGIPAGIPLFGNPKADNAAFMGLPLGFSKSFVEFQIVFTKIPLRTYVVPFVVAKLMSIYHF